MIVAIDGPSGAGKSTVAKAVAHELGFSCLDTGAMYRAVACKALADGVDLADADALAAIARDAHIEFLHQCGEPMPSQVAIDGRDVTAAIRTGDVDRAVSPVSAVPAVREALVAQQQRIGRAGDYVVEGRDIGTAVFPEAAVKVFLTASAEERAHRRVRQNVDRSVGSIDFDEVLADIVRRDELDSSRASSPLRAADDAVLLDSTAMHIEEVIGAICELARAAQADLAAAPNDGA
ncbi:(d)CMP kinase [Eggerthellaceae bacterium zg-887]|uniref:(d)CMP kinase n=1 Tax=Xiamenia xianingshaonis TaxID=2682776 RepID=UPI00140D1B34|nr:(d)CMP kinase [Xiamenia xianingshaonis]NHM16011.1 (d)CMP kinase [Xiamenia xianingshaonis]